MQGGGGGRGLHLGTGGVAGDEPQWRHGLAAEWLEMELIELLSGCTWVKGEWGVVVWCKGEPGVELK